MKNCTSWVVAISLLVYSAGSARVWGQDAVPQPTGSVAAGLGPTAPTQADASDKSNRADDSYIIGANDVLSVNVWNEPNLTRQVTVRSDGKISLPLIGELQAAGRTPAQLDQDITVVLKSYITDPQVAVIVQEIKSQNFNILGQVNKPGLYPLASGETIVDAIAVAGGLRDFAKKKDIYVLRQNAQGEQTRIKFNYQEFIKGKNIAQNIKLKPHDTIVVP